MKRGGLVALVVLGVVGALGGCRGVDQRELELRLDELATVVSEAKTPGPRSPDQVAAIDSQGIVLRGFVMRIAR